MRHQHNDEPLLVETLWNELVDALEVQLARAGPLLEPRLVSGAIGPHDDLTRPGLAGKPGRVGPADS